MCVEQSSDALSVIGFFLTLVGLIGSFFYIHLSDWFRDVITLKVKWDTNKSGDDQDQKISRRECRYEIEKVGGSTTLISSIVMTLFISLVTILSIIIWITQPEKSDVWIYIGIASVGFLLIYLSMTGYLLINGYSKTRALKKDIAEHFTRK